jgi:uracil-DNA glycosylase
VSDTLTRLVDRGLMASDWAEALAPVEGTIEAMGQFLRSEVAAGRAYLPAGDHVLRAFSAPLADVRVLIVGQDPYPTPGHPVGLSFSVAPDVRPLPPSLLNIFKELVLDLGVPPPTNGDLTSWTNHGVLLLNRVLTVEPGRSAAHRGKGWEKVTDRAIEVLAQRGGPMAAILWASRRPDAQADARGHPVGRVGASLPAVGPPGLLRVPSVQSRERPDPPAGGHPGGVAAPLTASDASTSRERRLNPA